MSIRIKNVKQVLDYWLMSEYLEQNEYPSFKSEMAKAGTALRNRKTDGKYNGKKIVDHAAITDFSKEIIEEVKNNPAANDKYPYLGEAIYFAMGKVKRNIIVSYLIELGDKEELIEMAYRDKAEIAWFSFSTDLNGKYVEHSFSFSRLLWAITSITKKKRKKELSFELDPKEYEKLIEKYENMLYEKKYPDFIQQLYTELYKEYIEYLDVPNAVNGVCALYRYAEMKDDKNNEKEENLTDLGRSFIAKDLELVSSKITDGSFGDKNKYQQQVLAYITAAVEPEKDKTDRIDISTKSPRETIKSFLREKLDPTAAPIGKWPSRYMSALMQQTAVNIAINEKAPQPIFSVNGPPGSGKTTLLKEIIAHYIVKRAELLCSVSKPDDLFVGKEAEQLYGEDNQHYYVLNNDKINDYSIIVASSNNTAVENITKDLPCKSDLIKGLTHSDSDTSQKARELDGIAKLFCSGSTDDSLCVSIEKNRQYISDVFFTYYAQQLFGSEDNWGLISAPLGKKENIYNYCTKFLKPLFYDSLDSEDERAKHQALFEKRKGEFCRQLAEVLEIQKQLYDLSAAPEKPNKNWIFKSKTTLKERLVGYKLKGDQPTVIDDAFMDNYYCNDEGHADSASTKAHTSDPWFTWKYNREREKLFYFGLMVHKEFVLSSDAVAKNIKLLLKMWKAINSSLQITTGTAKTIFPSLMQTLFLITPVISTTFDSMQTLMKNVDDSGTFGLLIVDEAGQATPAKAVGSLYRCRHSMIVGDPRQIEPVVTTETALIKEMITNDVTRPYMKKDLSVQLFADSLNPYGTYLKDEAGEVWVGCPLVVHRRCIDPMFSISNELSYDNKMKLQTAPPKDTDICSFIYGNSGWINVEGSENGNKDHFVEAQGRVVLGLLKTKLEKLTQGEKLNLFIISPFKSVKDGMKKMIEDSGLCGEYSILKTWIEDNIGTVHTFQGKGTDEVIFLMGCDASSAAAVNWVNKNIVNVAVTRAKYRFYAVGDKELWKGCEPVNTAIGFLEDIDASEFTVNVPLAKRETADKKSKHYKCPNCGGEVLYGKFGYWCKNKCGMELKRIYGYELSDEEVEKLLSGESVQYNYKGPKTAFPECKQANNEGEFVWKNRFDD